MQITHPYPRRCAGQDSILSVTIVYSDFLKAAQEAAVREIVVLRNDKVAGERDISDLGRRESRADVFPGVRRFLVIVHVDGLHFVRIGPS